MDGFTLENILKKDSFTRHIFQGIYSEDTLDKIEPGYACIANTSKNFEKGEHWIVVSNLRPTHVDFLCSYRSPPKSYKNIFKVMKATGKKIYQLPRRLQGDDSSACGPFVLFFFYCLSRHFQPSEMCHHFFSSSSSSSSRKSARALANAYNNDFFVAAAIRPLLSVDIPVEKLLYNHEFIKGQERGAVGHNDE